MVIYPRIYNEPTFPLEIIFIGATFLSVLQLLYLGFGWKEIQNAMVSKLSEAMPAIFILFCIGILIGSWMISGTIPMLIYYGIKIIDLKFIYIIAFIVPAIFSTFTGTSWGSVGTIGVVILALGNYVIAVILAITGIGCFYNEKEKLNKYRCKHKQKGKVKDGKL